MSFDSGFQLIDPRATQSMLAALLAGEAPPPSAFDQRDDSAERFSRARALILGADRVVAQRAADELVVQWSAASLPSVSMRNFAVTYHPLRMERELEDLPTAGWGSPRPWLFNELPEELSWSGVLEGNRSVGGYVWDARAAGAALRAYYDTLSPALRARVLPLLRLLRAAERHDLDVLESADLLDGASRGDELLRWPGLARFGLDGGPLTADEWRAFRRESPRRGDARDAIDRAGEIAPDDDASRGEALALFNADSAFFEEERSFQRALPWLAQCMDTARFAEATRAYVRVAAYARGPMAAPPASLAARLDACDDRETVEHWAARFGPSGLRPDAAIASALLRALVRTRAYLENAGFTLATAVQHLCRHGADPRELAPLLDDPKGLTMLGFIVDELRSDAGFVLAHSEALLSWVERGASQLTPEGDRRERASPARVLWALFSMVERAHKHPADSAAIAPSVARAWLSLYERAPRVALPFSDYCDASPTIVTAVVERLLRGAPTEALLRATQEVLSCGWRWEEGMGAWIEPFLREHRASLCALVELGLGSDDREARGAALDLLAPEGLEDARWAPALRAAIEREDEAAVERLAPRLSLEPRTASVVGEARAFLFATYEYGQPPYEAILELLPLGVDVSGRAMAQFVLARGDRERAGDKCATVALAFSAALLEAGYGPQAAAVLEAALASERTTERATLRYELARACARSGAFDRAADVLQSAVELDPALADRAARDADLLAVRAAR